MSKPAAQLQRAVPRPYRARAIWRGCKWAVDMRPWLGRSQAGSNFAMDSETVNRGRFSGNVPTPATNNRNGGRFVSSNGGGGAGTGVQWDDNQWQAIPQLGIYMWLDTGGMSLACTFQFRNALPNSNRRILTKRFGTAGYFHCGALSFNQTNGNKFEFSYSDGVGNVQSIFSGLVPSVGVTYNLVGKHTGNNATKRAELWVNGKLEAVNAAPLTYPAYKKDPPILFFTDTGSGDLTIDGEASMGGLWARPLTTAEVQALNVNPYLLWGPPTSPQGLPFAGPSGGVPGCNCCPGWLGSFNDM